MGTILDVYDSLSLGQNNNLSADFIGRGNLWINNNYSPATVKLARTIIYDALKNTAPGQLSILAYDGDLSGIFAPFADLSAGESKILEFVSTEKQLLDYLNNLQQQIQAVQNVIQGRSSSLLVFRNNIQRPVEGYHLVVLSVDMGTVSAEMRSKLSLLMRSGPACGISFLIVSTTFISYQTAGGKEIELKVDAMAPNITILEANESSVTMKGKNPVLYQPVSAEDIISGCSYLISNIRTTKLPTVKFLELHDRTKQWTESSIDGLTFCIGKYGVNNMEITLGDDINQRHNLIITGAVGQGKSNVISVIIHSLCMRYSPKELQLYLLDFKEGVTFAEFSNIRHEEYLPHAKTLGLESDVSFGIAVLQSLFREYQRRMKLLKEHNVKSIRELRQNNPSVELPRIVAVIDEFQMMFGDDAYGEGKLIAEQLEKSVRLFRAAGIHFILASQTLVGNMALAANKDSIFSQIPIRIALKNSESEARAVLNMNNAAAAYLRPREAIINLDYGEISQNRKTVIAFADEKELQPLRREMWEKARAYTKPPYVFESEKHISIRSGIDALAKFRKSGSVPSAIIGDKISIDGEHMILPMNREPGRNIAIFGTPDNDCNHADGMLQSIAASLAIQHPEGNARFIFCDFTSSDASYDKKYPVFATLMETTGFYLEIITKDDFANCVQQLLNRQDSYDDVYLFGSTMDRWEYEKDPYGGDNVLKQLVETGPAQGLHFAGWWVKTSKFNEQVTEYGSTDAFNAKIFLRIDERAVQSLSNPFVRWSSQINRALIVDDVDFPDDITFIPYAPIEKADENGFRTRIWD